MTRGAADETAVRSYIRHDGYKALKHAWQLTPPSFEVSTQHENASHRSHLKRQGANLRSGKCEAAHLDHQSFFFHSSFFSSFFGAAALPVLGQEPIFQPESSCFCCFAFGLRWR